MSVVGCEDISECVSVLVTRTRLPVESERRGTSLYAAPAQCSWRHGSIRHTTIPTRRSPTPLHVQDNIYRGMVWYGQIRRRDKGSHTMVWYGQI